MRADANFLFGGLKNAVSRWFTRIWAICLLTPSVKKNGTCGCRFYSRSLFAHRRGACSHHLGHVRFGQTGQVAAAGFAQAVGDGGRGPRTVHAHRDGDARQISQFTRTAASQAGRYRGAELANELARIEGDVAFTLAGEER